MSDNIKVKITEDSPINVNVGVANKYINDHNLIYNLGSFYVDENTTGLKKIILGDLPVLNKCDFNRNTTIETIIMGDIPLLGDMREKVRYLSGLKIFIMGNLPKVSDCYGIAINNRSIEKVELGNIPSGYRFQQAFAGCYSLKSVKIGDISHSNTNQYMFQNCTSLVDLTLGDFSGASNVTQMFSNCTALENLTFTGSTCSISFNLSYCSRLTHDSLMSVLNALPSIENSATLTLGTINKNKLTLEEMEIATNKGWQIA